MKDNNIYIKKDNGRYVPYGIAVNEDYLFDGIWYVRHNDYSRSITNADKYLPSLFKLGDKPEKIDIPKLCAMNDYVNYVLESKEFKELCDNGKFSFNDLTSKIVALVIDLNKKYTKRNDNKH